MIPLDYEQAFVLYVAVWLFFLLILWGREIWRAKVYDWALSEGRLCICEDCHFAFLVKPGVSVSRCPRCDEVCLVRQKIR